MMLYRPIKINPMYGTVGGKPYPPHEKELPAGSKFLHLLGVRDKDDVRIVLGLSETPDFKPFYIKLNVKAKMHEVMLVEELTVNCGYASHQHVKSSGSTLTVLDEVNRMYRIPFQITPDGIHPLVENGYPSPECWKECKTRGDVKNKFHHH